MNIKDCMKESGKSYGTIQNYLNKRGLKSTKGIKEISIKPEDWKQFCDDHEIEKVATND